MVPAGGAGAQTDATETFVSNTGFSAPGQISTLSDYAQAFTTGSGAASYDLHSVDVEFRRIGTTPAQGNSQSWVTAEIREDSGGSPGDLVGTLANPDFFDFNFRHVLTFTSADGIRLAAGTTYFFVLDVSPPNGWTGYPRLSTANTGAEDAGGLPGWSIADNRVSRGASTSDPYTGTSSPLMIRLAGVSHECDETQDFRGGGHDSPSVRYVGIAAHTETYTPYAAANRCAPLVTAGGTFTLTFTADSRVSAVGATGPVSIDSATGARKVGRWLIGATSSPPSTATFRAGQVSGATVAHIRLAPSGSNYRATRIPVVIVPPPGLPVVSVTATDNIVQAASLTITEGQNVSFVIARPDGFTGAVNTRLSRRGGDVLTDAAKTILGERSTPGGFIGADTVDDDAWEQDGLVTLDLLPGDGYRVSSSQGSATVRVRDNDGDRLATAKPTAVTLGPALPAGNKRQAFFGSFTGSDRHGNGGPCQSGVWTGASWEAGSCVKGTEDTYTLALAADPGGRVTVWARVDSGDAGICQWSHDCNRMRRSRSNHNHRSLSLAFDSSNWDAARTVTVYRFPQAGAGTATISHTDRYHNPLGAAVTVTLTGASQYQTVPAPDPEPVVHDTIDDHVTDYASRCGGNLDRDTPRHITGVPGVDCRPPARSGTVTEPPVQRPEEPACAVRPGILKTVQNYHNANLNRGGYQGNWARVLAAFGHTPAAPWNNATALTAAQARAQEAHWKGWTPIRIELQRLDECNGN